MWSNFHTHCNYCDGKGELKDYVTEAKSLNLISLGFSSHAPLPFPNRWCMKPDQLNHYLNDIDELKSSNPAIGLYKSLEIDYIPGLLSPDNFRDKLDYTIGSIHFVENLPDGTPWEIDGTHAFFLEGFQKIFNNNIRDVIVRYYELTREMIEKSPPTIIGHLDKIKIQNVDNRFFHESESWYQEEIKKTLYCIKAAGCIVEVNTRGIYKKKFSDTYPGRWILQKIHYDKIPITLSSDAHHPDDLIKQFPETAAMLHSIGFKKITILHEGLWKEVEMPNA